MTINFLAETTWPGEVQVGGRLLGIGNRSFRSAYGVFRDERCLATAECVSVWFDPRAAPLGRAARRGPPGDGGRAGVGSSGTKPISDCRRMVQSGHQDHHHKLHVSH